MAHLAPVSRIERGNLLLGLVEPACEHVAQFLAGLGFLKVHVGNLQRFWRQDTARLKDLGGALHAKRHVLEPGKGRDRGQHPQGGGTLLHHRQPVLQRLSVQPALVDAPLLARGALDLGAGRTIGQDAALQARGRIQFNPRVRRQLDQALLHHVEAEHVVAGDVEPLVVVKPTVVQDDVDVGMIAIGVQRRHIGPLVVNMGAGVEHLEGPILCDPQCLLG